MQPQPEPRHHFSQQLAEVLPVPIVPVNGAPFIAPPGEMIPSAGLLNSQWSGHATEFIPDHRTLLIVKCRDVTPMTIFGSPQANRFVYVIRTLKRPEGRAPGQCADAPPVK